MTTLEKCDEKRPGDRVIIVRMTPGLSLQIAGAEVVQRLDKNMTIRARPAP